MTKKAPPLVAALLVLLFAAGACRNLTAPATEVPPGFVQVSHHDSGVTLAVPGEWIQIPMPKNSNVARFNETATDLILRDPRLVPAVNQARQVLQSGGKAFAVSEDGQMRVNVTVDKTKEKTLDQLAANVVESLEQGGAIDLVQARAPTGVGEALKLTFKFPIDAAGNETVLADEVQYYVLHDGKSYVLTVINGPPDLPDTVARSLRLR